MHAPRLLVAFRAEQPVEPAVAQAGERRRRRVCRAGERSVELRERDALLVLAAADRVGVAGDAGVEILAGPEQVERCALKRADTSRSSSPSSSRSA